ncbi:unnamed protein product [Closterium sp. Yama58-4]|nr:unnamed protein product [Closterium sp. Yama58-4]
MSGSIPTAIGKLTNLILLCAHNLFLLAAASVTLGLQHRCYSGVYSTHAPVSLRDLGATQLYGSVPRTLSNLSKLQFFSKLTSFGCSYPAFPKPVPIAIPPPSLPFHSSSNQFTGRLPSPSFSTTEMYKVNNNFFSHGEVKFRNCFAVTWSIHANCLAASMSVCSRASTQRPAPMCTAFCGLEVGSTGPVCGGHGYCSVDEFTAAGECVCDPNYLLNSTNTNSCVPGAVGASLASGSAYVSLQGSAAVLSNGSILLTGGAPNQQGAAFASPSLRLFYFPNKRSLCGIELAFTAAFSFAMRPAGQGAGGEGLAFVVAAVASGKGASVGLGGVGRRSVAVEFDSVLSVKHSDPNDNHVGVNVGGSPVSLASATAPLILNDAHTKHAWIHYDPTSAGTLRVFLSSDPHQPPTPTLTASVSLCSVLKPTASDSLFLFGFVALSGS